LLAANRLAPAPRGANSNPRSFQQESPLQAEATPPKRHRRFWLYAPYAVLLLLAVAWSIGWFVLRGRMEAGLDAWVAREAAAGRRWTCADRHIAGFPFRIELFCSGMILDRPDLQAKLGPVTVVSQVYKPGHMIAETAGPLQINAGSTAIEATWSLLQASVQVGADGPQQGDLVADKPVVKVTSAQIEPLTVTAERLESHVRTNPAEATTADWALRAGAAVIPGLDGLIGGTEPANLDVVAAVTRARDLPARPIAAELERWRAAGGRVEISRLGLVKGPRQIEGKGSLGLDEVHRPQGQLDVASARIEGFLGQFIGAKAGGAAALIGALLGAPPARSATGGQNAGLTPLPPLRLDGGKLRLGPLVIPGVRLDPLY
jgi:hypothetical protein